MKKDMTEVKPLLPGLFTLYPEPRLLGSRCPGCEKQYFPVKEICPRCYQTGQEEILLDSNGRIRAFTVVHAKPPQRFGSPYVVGYVDLVANNLTIPALLAADYPEDVQVGAVVSLVIEPISPPSGERDSFLIYKFKVKREA